jgi:hypothetical protein
VLAFIPGDGHDDMVKQLDRPLNNIQMPIRQWIKAAWINGRPHGAESSISTFNDEEEKEPRGLLKPPASTGALKTTTNRHSEFV